MKKNIWIINHYATNMPFDHGGRHYWFAENLLKRGYKPRIICASAMHGSNVNIIRGKELYKEDIVDNIPFTFVKTPSYKGNGINRILNMISFFLLLFPMAIILSKRDSKPDIIIGSSVHPLTCVASLLIAKKFKVPCVVEIRDLWPEVLVEYGAIKRHSLLARLLYAGEKWIYKKADAVIFTCMGGKDYLIEKGWDKVINLSKVHYINNGMDLSEFDSNAANNIIQDPDLEDENTFKIIYCGSIRMVNALDLYIDSAEEIMKLGYQNIKFLVYGDGDEKEPLEKRCQEKGISNVVFKGRVPKKNIPYIVSRANINLLEGRNMPLYRFGLSPNKLFEYFAAGKPIVSTIKSGYDLLDQYNCGISLESNHPRDIASAIANIYNMPGNEYLNLCRNSRSCASIFDFKELTEKLIEVIENPMEMN